MPLPCSKQVFSRIQRTQGFEFYARDKETNRICNLCILLGLGKTDTPRRPLIHEWTHVESMLCIHKVDTAWWRQSKRAVLLFKTVGSKETREEDAKVSTGQDIYGNPGAASERHAPRQHGYADHLQTRGRRPQDYPQPET